MKIVIKMAKEKYEWIKKNNPNADPNSIVGAITNGTPLPNITDEKISDAFQIAIANYWEEKSKYLTPPPTPAQCRDCSNEKGEEE